VTATTWAQAPSFRRWATDRFMTSIADISMTRLSRRRMRGALTSMLAWVPLILCMALLISSKVHAQTTCTLGSGGAEVLAITMSATATIPRDAPVGTVISQGSVTPPAFNPSNPVGITCTGTDAIWSVLGIYSNLMSGLPSDANGVMPTGIAGIGFKVIVNGAAWGTGTATYPASSFAGSACGGAALGCFLTISGASASSPVMVQYVNTGPITGVYTIPGGNLYQVALDGVVTSTISITNSVNVTGQTCSVQSSSVSVPMGAVNMSVFDAVGSTSSPVPFQISLNCTGSSMTVGMTMTDLSDPGNTTDILSLTSNSTATGVGIRVTHSNGNPVSFGADSAVAGNPNQFIVSTAGSSNVNAQFNAQYIKTKTTITPGTADGVASFTMSYQ
jgi:type 1 fimbria pilin